MFIHKKDLVTIAVFTLLTVIAWIVFEVYHAVSESTVTETETRLVIPLDPHLNPETLRFTSELENL